MRGGRGLLIGMLGSLCASVAVQEDLSPSPGPVRWKLPSKHSTLFAGHTHHSHHTACAYGHVVNRRSGVYLV